jgi:hypothetical protein
VPIVVNGHAGSFYPDGSDEPGAPALDVLIGNWELQIVVNPAVASRYPLTALIKIASQVTFAPNAADQATWFPSGQVLP